jgi:hypothetical protein
MEHTPIDPENTNTPDSTESQVDSTPSQTSEAQAEETQTPEHATEQIVPVVEAEPEPEASTPEVAEKAPESTAAVLQLVAEEEEQAGLTTLPVQEEEVDVEPIEHFGQMGKEELVQRMEQFSKEGDVNQVKNRVQAAKEAFQAIAQPEKDQAFEAFIAAGGVKEDFEYKDPLEERFFSAYKHYQKRRTDHIQGQEKARSENLRQKNEILHQMKEILQKEEDMSKAFNEFHDLQAKWRGIGPVPPQNVNDLWLTYKLYSDRFYEFIRLNRELQDLEMKKNLEMKMQLCERAEELLLESSLNKAMQEMQGLQNKWREIGSVPREKRTEIWLRFKAAVDKVYENKRSHLDSQRKVLEENLTAKNALIAQAGEIIAKTYSRHNEWQEGLQQLLEVQTAWRKIGPAPKEQNDSIWQAFKSTCDQFFRNKDAFYKQKKQEYSANLQAKTELCIQAESLIESTDWKNTTNTFVRLQQEWKKLGPAGEKNEKVWQRFKKACDAYFERKNLHFADQDQAQGGNLEAKNALITEVEQYIRPSDPGEALEQLKAFQRRYTEIGLVPMKNKEDIQQRFRAAIQSHFDALKSTPEYRQSLRQMHGQNERNDSRPYRGGDRPQRSNHQPEAGGSDEQRQLQTKMTKLTGEVQLWENNLGFFANSKNASSLRQEYEAKIQQAKDEIQKLKDRLKELKSAT